MFKTEYGPDFRSQVAAQCLVTLLGRDILRASQEAAMQAVRYADALIAELAKETACPPYSPPSYP